MFFLRGLSARLLFSPAVPARLGRGILFLFLGLLASLLLFSGIFLGGAARQETPPQSAPAAVSLAARPVERSAFAPAPRPEETPRPEASSQPEPPLAEEPRAATDPPAPHPAPHPAPQPAPRLAQLEKARKPAQAPALPEPRPAPARKRAAEAAASRPAPAAQEDGAQNPQAQSGLGRPAENSFHREGDLDTPPRAVYAPAPEYPAQARRNRREGRVVVRVLLDERGRVVRGQILPGADAESFGRAALDAVRRWRFTPGLKDGSPVRAEVEVPILFRIRGF